MPVQTAVNPRETGTGCIEQGLYSGKERWGSRGFAIADYLLEYVVVKMVGERHGGGGGHLRGMRVTQSTVVLQALYEMLGQNLVCMAGTGLILALPGRHSYSPGEWSQGSNRWFRDRVCLNSFI